MDIQRLFLQTLNFFNLTIQMGQYLLLNQLPYILPGGSQGGNSGHSLQILQGNYRIFIELKLS